MSKPQLAKLHIEGAEMAVRLAGEQDMPAVLLVHGFPSSSESFRDVIGPLAQQCFVIAPDLPGYGGSEPTAHPSFSRFADMIDGLLAQLGVASFHLYLHDYGAAAALYLATRTPQKIRSLIVQNANAHDSGMGRQWDGAKDYWADPTPEREAAVTGYLSFEGMREQYVGGVPADIAKRVDPKRWEDDWRIMSLLGRLDLQRALLLDYRSHVARFAEIAEYLRRWQPPALMLWGRHDIFFDVDETLSWMKALPRMEAHILDGPHFLLETHATECAELMRAFIGQVEARR